MSKRVERAAEIGREHREMFIAEFGKVPVEGQIGDWDAIGLSEMWKELKGGDDYNACREAYLTGLFRHPTKTTVHYELAVQQRDGIWEHLGDFDTEDQAIKAAKMWAKDNGDNSKIWHDDFGTAVFGISSDPHSSHYERGIEDSIRTVQTTCDPER